MQIAQKLVGILMVLGVGLTLPALSQAKTGPFFQAGMVGSIDLQDSSDAPNLELGPGAHGVLGYVFGLFGVRGSFFYANMDQERTNFFGANEVEVWGGSLDFLIYPMHAMGYEDSAFQPYFVLGAGGYLFEPQQTVVPVSAEGIGGNFGMGVNFHLVERLSVGAEGTYRPIAFFQNNNPALGVFGTDSFDKHFFTVVGLITLHFGK